MDNPNFDADDDFLWDDDMAPSGFGEPPVNWRNERYNNAFGNYRGGYGPGGGFGPPRFHPHDPESGFPFGPPTHTWGRGFGPGGPPSRNRHHINDKAARYLMRCSVPKDVVRNLPKALLDLIDPQYCGLCATQLDSLALSRLHYNSKNHIKNQKKWMSKYHEGYQRGREIPMKSRNLYCELCDVQITSTAHAESHYAGRPHRAIIEGRKVPKNTFLLQRGMENRVQQLIRREKKNLKPLECVEVQEDTKDVKNISPELYCAICKTSVTCTEQMTMHLNGKRHLSKEKHHILNMMKGDDKDNKKEKVHDTIEIPEEDSKDEVVASVEIADEDSKDKVAATIEIPDEDSKDKADATISTYKEDAVQKGEENKAEDNPFDWGSGGGDWEET